MQREPLFHATSLANLESIKHWGLCPSGFSKNFDWCEDGVYLTNYKDIALSFIDDGVIETEEGLRLLEEGVVLLEIDQDKLDRSKMHCDNHYSVDEDDDGVMSYRYNDIIPFECVKKVHAC